MEKVINLGIPHVAELIFESIDTPELIKCLEVSETWNILAENVLFKRWKGKMSEACKSGKTEIVRILLERSENINIELNARDEDGSTAFILACEYGRKDVVQLLLDNSNVITINDNEDSTSKLVCNNGQKIAVYMLIAHDLNARDAYGFTAFMNACINGHKDVVKLLLDHSDNNIDVNATDNAGWTAFMYACSYGKIEVVKLLLDHSDNNIDLNATDNAGMTAFMHACREGHKDVVKVLIECSNKYNINLNATGIEGWTALIPEDMRHLVFSNIFSNTVELDITEA